MCNSAMRPVCGSTSRTTAFTDRTNNKRGKLPSRDAVLESTTTRSSLQASAKVTRDVYWWLNKFDFGSALTNFLVSLTLQGTQSFKNCTNRTASLRWRKKKSRPSRNCSIFTAAACAFFFNIACSK